MNDPYNQSREYLESLQGIVGGVQIMSMRDQDVCDPCFEHDGTFYDLPEAMEKRPLPHDDCGSEVCRCTYRPVDREKFRQEKRLQDQETD